MTVEFKKIDHIITEQYIAEQAFLAEYHKGEFSLETPFVRLNPYLIAPLTALVCFKTKHRQPPVSLLKAEKAPATSVLNFRRPSIIFCRYMALPPILRIKWKSCLTAGQQKQ